MPGSKQGSRLGELGQTPPEAKACHCQCPKGGWLPCCQVDMLSQLAPAQLQQQAPQGRWGWGCRAPGLWLKAMPTKQTPGDKLLSWPCPFLALR